MGPVAASSTSRWRQPSRLATAAASRREASKPALPVSALAQPELATRALDLAAVDLELAPAPVDRGGRGGVAGEDAGRRRARREAHHHHVRALAALQPGARGGDLDPGDPGMAGKGTASGET